MSGLVCLELCFLTSCQRVLTTQHSLWKVKFKVSVRDVLTFLLSLRAHEGEAANVLTHRPLTLDVIG